MGDLRDPIPSLLANLLQACHFCCRDELDLYQEKRRLYKCPKCSSVAYCGQGCQKDDWKFHKELCKAFCALEKDYEMKQIAIDHLPPEIMLPTQMSWIETTVLNRLARENALEEMRFFRMTLGREPTFSEGQTKSRAAFDSNSGRTDRMISVGAEVPPPTAPLMFFKNIPEPKKHALKACSTCQSVFYCSEEHWQSARPMHATLPAEGGFDCGRTQCQLFDDIRVDSSFMATMTEGSGMLVWNPTRIKQQWEPLRDGQARKNWEEEYGELLKEHFKDEMTQSKEAEEASLPPSLRAISVGLSMPMTILYVLQRLNADEEWTRKPELTIHVIGASSEKEVPAAVVFDEMLHRLPELEHLRLVFVGPDIEHVIKALRRPNTLKPEYMNPCEFVPFSYPRFPTLALSCASSECLRRNRKRTHELHAMLYHEYVENLDSKFMKPDLAIAFNSGANTYQDDNWKETIEVLVKRKIPSAFTSFSEDEARDVVDLLKEVGATLVPGMGPERNPWGSSQLVPELLKLTGFYSDNRWLAGGLRG
ncbi:hypothetical protein PQX77_015638 [Marasmius sp. AFHP31]|nr:hypothetical protein PQX77_015638 [Marasmius sp. AFHP31]